jgi:hypothetical protein
MLPLRRQRQQRQQQGRGKEEGQPGKLDRERLKNARRINGYGIAG